jgi:hypothetical protein
LPGAQAPGTKRRRTKPQRGESQPTSAESCSLIMTNHCRRLTSDESFMDCIRTKIQASSRYAIF